VSPKAPEIRPARPDDLEPALRAMSEAFGTPYRVPSVHTLALSLGGHLLVAEREGAIVGTSCALSFGASAWIGGVTVAPQARGARLGETLTSAALDAVGPHPTIQLLATPAGRPIYDRLGFTPELAYSVHEGVSRARPRGPSGFVPADRETALALDRHATGEDRSGAVEAALEGAVMTADGTAVALAPPWPSRPIYARDPAAGAALLAAVTAPGLQIAVPQPNAAAVRALGCRHVRDVVRMRRGVPLDWRAEAVWGTFALYFG
jgi:predicted N-acetyltransferase YhbS